MTTASESAEPGSVQARTPTVDCHAHVVPPDLSDALEARAFPGVFAQGSRSAGYCFGFPGVAVSPTAPPAISDPVAALAWMEERGVDVQLLSPWTDVLGYTLERAQAASWTRRMNTGLAQTAVGGCRFEALGSVPLQWPDLAAEELAEARRLGCRGVMIGTAAPGVELDDRRLDDLWSAAAELSMPVIVHPTFLDADARLAPYSLSNAVGRANEMAIAGARLLYGGALSRHPDLVVVLVHGGGAIPSLLSRLRRTRAVFAPDAADPHEGFARLYFDSLVFDPESLRALLRMTTPDRVVLGSDYPFPWEPWPRRVVEEAGLGESATTAILGGNARRIFGLGVGDDE